jgi:ankyrin repeat protein
MNIFEAVREGKEEMVSSLISADPTLLEKAEEGGGDTPLLVAVEHGKADMVKLLLKEGANIDGTGHKGETALMRAITRGNEELMSLVLGYGARVDLADDVGKTPLMWASIQGHLGLVRLVFEAMLERGSQKGVDRRGRDGKTALHHAAEGGHFEVVAYLLCKEARDNIKDRSGNTPLVLACAKGHLTVIGMLLEAREGQGLREMGAAGWMGLHYAAEGGHKDIVTFLISKEAEANATNRGGSTPFMLACRKGHLEVVEMLFEATKGVGLNEQDHFGRTALQHAAVGGHKDIVTFLLNKRAEANTRNRERSTPFMGACAKGHLDVVQILHAATEGQWLEQRDYDGRTALQCAAEDGHRDVVAFLLSKGAQANTRDVDGSTPFMKACWNGHLGVAQILHGVTKGQGLEEGSNGGHTALHFAASGGHKEIVAFLLLKGAQANSRDADDTTPFMCACKIDEECTVEVVQMLLEATEGQGLEDRDKRGETALHWAAIGGRKEVVAFLLSKGADASTKDAIQETPLMKACRREEVGVVQLLLKHTGGQGLSQRNTRGETALHLASSGWRSSNEVVKVLLVAGADQSITNNQGRTPRQAAEQQERHRPCVEAFKVIATVFSLSRSLSMYTMWPVCSGVYTLHLRVCT